MTQFSLTATDLAALHDLDQPAAWACGDTHSAASHDNGVCPSKRGSATTALYQRPLSAITSSINFSLSD